MSAGPLVRHSKSMGATEMFWFPHLLTLTVSYSALARGSSLAIAFRIFMDK
jgi:hypothetical protein